MTNFDLVPETILAVGLALSLYYINRLRCRLWNEMAAYSALHHLHQDVCSRNDCLEAKLRTLVKDLREVSDQNSGPAEDWADQWAQELDQILTEWKAGR